MIGIFIVMLMISSALITILFSDHGTVEANDDVNLDYDYVWDEVQHFANVIHNVNWSGNGENSIPKGRSWATSGEDYTINEILDLNINGSNSPCGLTGYTLLPIKYVNTDRGKEPGSNNKPKQYSTKIVINDYSLTLENGSEPYQSLPYSEFFPHGIGLLPYILPIIRTHFSSATIRDLNDDPITNPFANATEKYFNISVKKVLYNGTGLLAGTVKYIKDNQSIPEDQNDTVFLMNESISCETKIQNITDNTTGCILIYDQNRNYNFNDAEGQNCSFAQINCTNRNLSLLLSGLENGTEYFVMLDYEAQTLSFFNLSNYQTDIGPWVGLMRLRNESDPKGTGFDEVIDQNIKCFNYSLHNPLKFCKAIIIAGPGDTHFMLHTVNGWGWFNQINTTSGPYKDWPLTPMFSVNESVWNWLHQRIDTATVSGFIDQTPKRQTRNHPGVISHNVVAYRNISHSPDDKIVVLSNRIDGWFSEAPGDSGVGGAILLGIAKYFKDNNITPKYNLTFLFTTGEEYGMRGAQHFVDTHPNGTGSGEYNYVHWIGFDQLGFNLTGDGSKLQTEIKTQNESRPLLRAIANDTDYKNRTKDYYDFYVNYTHGGGCEDYVWTNNCPNTILFDKGGGWNGWHRAGVNYSEGDSIKNIDRNDVDVTFELAWNITKYFCVNHNCWFDSVNYQSFDSNGGTIPDSIKATFTVKSSLPSDKVLINASLYNATTEQPVTNKYYSLNLVINTTGVEQNVSFSMPFGVNEGDYYIRLEVFNSTARINRSLGYSHSSNGTETSPTFHLNKYHTLGDIRIGTTSTSVHNLIRGSKYTPTEDALIHNITAYVSGSPTNTPVYQCIIYRWSDGRLIASTNQIQKSSTGWMTFSFNPRPLLRNNTEYVLSIWGDNNAYIYSTYTYPMNNGYANDSFTFGTPPINITWDYAITYQHSLFCHYGLDLYQPKITNISASPETAGFGYNVTITANVSDNGSGLKEVKIRINDPGEMEGNYTMTHVSGDLYQYEYTDTWVTGQYNYSIWALDNETNSNTSSTYHFHVSAEATVSIATLKNSYTGTQYINITDPPNPQDNLTLVGRGLTWNTYYNASSGENILETYQGPTNYLEVNNTWLPINNTISPLAENHPAYIYGYRNGNNHGLYGSYFKANAQQEWPVAFTFNRSNDPTIYAVRSKLLAVGYVDPQSNWAYQYLQNVQSSQGQTTDNSITYKDVFTGTDVTWTYGNTGLKEEITLSNATKTVLQNHPPHQYGLNDASSYLVFITKLDYQSLNLYNHSGLLTGNITISDSGVDLKDLLGQFKCALPLGEAYELNNESMRQKLTYRIIHLNGNTYLLSGLKISKLNAMTFPVVIDPTLTVYTTSADGYIYKSGTSYSTVQGASTGTTNSTRTYLTIGQWKITGVPNTYYVNRGFVYFNTSALPTNAYLDNATLSLYKKDDYSATDFDLTIQNGQPTNPHNPMQTGDYNKNYYSGNGGRFNTTSFTSGYNAIHMNNLSWINKTGVTKLCLRSSRDISGTAPTGNEYINVYSYEHPGIGYQPKLVINYRNQSKIKNTGSTDIKGYLLVQVQFYNSTQGKWLVDKDTINETTARVITSGNQLALDTIFNGYVRVSDLTHGTGTYRVYTAFRDPEGNILRTNGDIDLEAWWQFNKT